MERQKANEDEAKRKDQTQRIKDNIALAKQRRSDPEI
jgi:hypothetical protein